MKFGSPFPRSYTVSRGLVPVGIFAGFKGVPDGIWQAIQGYWFLGAKPSAGLCEFCFALAVFQVKEYGKVVYFFFPVHIDGGGEHFCEGIGYCSRWPAGLGHDRRGRHG